MEGPLVSVVIPAYNAARFLPEALSSVFSQTYSEYEVIVVNDGSTDRTDDVLAPFMSRIHYIKQENRGIGRARNRAIAASKGEWIATLDADDLWLPHKLDLQVSLIAEGVGLVGSSGGETDPEGRGVEDVSYPELLVRNRFSASSVMFRRSSVAEGDVFNADRKCRGVEDWELWLRIVSEHRALYVRNQMVVIRAVEGSVSSLGNTEKMFQSEKTVLRLQRNLAEGLRPSRRLLAEAWSYRYFCVSWANLMAGEHARALWRIVCAFVIYFPTACRRENFGLFLRILGACVGLGGRRAEEGSSAYLERP